MSRYGIAEWFGEPFAEMSVAKRKQLAAMALGEIEAPHCPFQRNHTQCRKKGGVCSIQRYAEGVRGRIGPRQGDPVIVCPERFKAGDLVTRWLADVVGLDKETALIAFEVPFMHSTVTDKPAGRIDLVLANDDDGNLVWYGLEIQAVYFSGKGMTSEFERLLADSSVLPPYPNAIRRPDWRSSSAKRLMPQLQVKVPTLRRWGTKLAVSVDRQFFESIGGPSPNPVQDLDEGEVIWLVPEVSSGYRLQRWHWETLSLEDSTKKLLAARTVNRTEFEKTLRSKLHWYLE
ncbi:MAG: NotI family restriction endonuclease [Anaerolineaceae bacterium]|nr:NotI family restriction endonuclease [Anaerolineaceae bacterium]MDE0327996.1 NotI family restriction endonuclease [Anaerolineaceae bacterium]